MRYHLTIICPIFAALAACGSSTPVDEKVVANDPEAIATATMAVVASDKTQLPLTAEPFIDAIAANSKFVIESSRIVQAAGLEQPFTDFAQLMIRDHENLVDELVKAANSVPDAFVDDQNLTDEQKAMLDALREAAGPELLALYERQQLEAHKKALAMLQTYAASGDNRELMAFAGHSLPVVNRHLAAAQRLP